jgi:phage gp37-like protein
MLALKDIEDALIAHIKANISGVKTCDTHETEIDEQTLAAMLPKSPFVLIRYAGTEPVEDQRMATGGSGMKKREFGLVIGTQSVRSKKEAQHGAYDLLDDLREKYDGGIVTVNGEALPFAYEGDHFIFKIPGLIIYAMILSWTED